MAQPVERAVYGLERLDARHDAREVEIAGERERGEPGKIGGGVPRSVVRAADALVGEELDRGEGDLHSFGASPTTTAVPPRPDAVPGEAHRLRPTTTSKA